MSIAITMNILLDITKPELNGSSEQNKIIRLAECVKQKYKKKRKKKRKFRNV